MEWRERCERAAARYKGGETRELDERQLVQLANAAWAAGLSLLMDGDREGATKWLRLAAARYRESWDAGAAADAWGRPIGAMKALLIAGDDAREPARWAIYAEAANAESPIGRYAAALALLILDNDEMAARHAADLQREASFPRDVADSLAAIASRDADAYAEALARVRRSFDEREDFLEDVPVADTALALTRSRPDADSSRASRRPPGRVRHASSPRSRARGCPGSPATAPRRVRGRPRPPCPLP